MKKLLTFLLCFVFMLGAFGLVACDETVTEQKITQNTYEKAPMAHLSVQGVKLGGLVASRFSGGNESSNNEQEYLSKTITATVLPENAINKSVDFEVSWADDATLKDEDVSEYVVVEQATDGALTATVKCFQNFGDDVIIIRCITRDGGYMATCIVTYAGLASEMSIVPEDNISTVNTTNRGDYYELLTGRTYYFDINLTDALGNSAKTSNLQITQSFSGDSHYISLFTGYDGSNGYTVADSGRHDFHNIEFFEGSITNDGKLKIVTREKTVNNKTFYGDNSILHYVLSNSTVTNNPNNSQALYSYLYGNDNTISNKTMQIVVTDSLSGLSQTIKFWTIAGVNSVSLSPQSLQF